MDLDEFRQKSHQTWGKMAPGWERWRAQLAEGFAPMRQWLVAALEPKPGQTVLELSAGPGDTGFEVARALGGGRLICSDFNAEMVEVARRRGGALGLDNVEYRVIDAEKNPLDSDAVDGVVCQFGYMLMADPRAALTETRRVLRPGGRLALAVWSVPERNPWAATAARVLVEQGHVDPPEPGAPGIFALADRDRTVRLLEEAGFGSVRSEEVPTHLTFRDVDAYMTWLADVAGRLALVLRQLDAGDRRAVAQRLEQELASYRGATGYALPGAALMAVAS